MAVTELESTDYWPFYYLGLCSVAQSDAERARSWFKKATERINPDIAQKRLDELVRVRETGQIQ